ncbi:hypothetical protein PIIN_09408 [Serendipita indica DSM 11827]|uniref:Uncharacterized protein n=1 Tax=Serendipita indica (strain DSM 11827) TaxID=1109443 RepID=G4TVT2_SERID|nr:hypothetical protein PIIN_09408 [Serendipita indica DSM 11827]
MSSGRDRRPYCQMARAQSSEESDSLCVLALVVVATSSKHALRVYLHPTHPQTASAPAVDDSSGVVGHCSPTDPYQRPRRGQFSIVARLRSVQIRRAFSPTNRQRPVEERWTAARLLARPGAIAPYKPPVTQFAWHLVSSFCFPLAKILGEDALCKTRRLDAMVPGAWRVNNGMSNGIWLAVEHADGVATEPADEGGSRWVGNLGPHK